ncbi:DGQHR domain-containing protein [Paraglaciecola chathamensis]|uniref:DGQHR domain-containing protein n=1 Tax=Paraglaciecola chathamensis TaxID=368405 RepID=UPI0026FB5FC6|nr:DGQHR domain-containing protein [Paraglaciecola chathamensis]MDO6559911.1 DGQHR domain-containing protein [Paraglaciecola chathamensis]
MKNTIEIDAIKIEYNEGVYYLASFCAKELFNLTMVTRAEEDPETGYQRTLSKGRVNKIATYLDDGNMIPGSLILSSTAPRADYDDKEKKLRIEKKSSSLLVIDGQHRLYGSYKSQEDVYLPVCIFFGLDKGTEVQYFLDVNGHQMGVPKTLRLELEKFTADENSEEFLLKVLFDELDYNPLSPLSGKMSRTKSVSGKLSHVAFQNAMKPILTKAPFNVFTLEQKKKVLINFMLALETITTDIFDDNRKVANSAFFQAVMSCFMDICHVAESKFGGYKQNHFEKALEPISNINWDLHSGTNKSAIKNLAQDLVTSITTKVTISDDQF